MIPTADSVRHLTRAYIGARVSQGLLFWFALVHNISGVLESVGEPSTRLKMWLLAGAIVAAATLGTYYRWRFGRVEPPRPSLSRQVARGVAFAVLLMVVLAAMGPVVISTGARPADLLWLLLSAGAATSLATSCGERLGWVVPLLASAGLFATLTLPALEPYRALGYAGMAASLVVAAIQLHLLLVRGFRHAQV
jgi:hypothetical protein